MTERCRWRSGSSISSAVPGAAVITLAATMVALRSPSDICAMLYSASPPRCLASENLLASRIFQQNRQRCVTEKLIQLGERRLCCRRNPSCRAHILPVDTTSNLAIARILLGNQIKKNCGLSLRLVIVPPSRFIPRVVSGGVLVELPARLRREVTLPDANHALRCAAIRVTWTPQLDATKCCSNADLPEPLAPTTKMSCPVPTISCKSGPERRGIVQVAVIFTSQKGRRHRRRAVHRPPARQTRRSRGTSNGAEAYYGRVLRGDARAPYPRKQATADRVSSRAAACFPREARPAAPRDQPADGPGYSPATGAPAPRRRGTGFRWCGGGRRGRFVPRHPPLAEVGLALARAAPRRSSAPVRSDPTSGRRNTLAASAAPAAGEPAARREPDALAAPVAAVRGGLTSGSRRRGSGILHHATTISIRGDSYRLKDKLKSGVVKPTTAGA